MTDDQDIDGSRLKVARCGGHLQEDYVNAAAAYNGILHRSEGSIESRLRVRATPLLFGDQSLQMPFTGARKCFACEIIANA